MYRSSGSNSNWKRDGHNNVKIGYMIESMSIEMNRNS